MNILMSELLVDGELNVLETNQQFRDAIKADCRSFAEVISQRDIINVYETIEMLGESDEKVLAVRVKMAVGTVNWMALAINMGIGEQRRKIYRMSLWNLEDLRDDLRILQQRLDLFENDRESEAYNYHFDTMLHVFNKETIIKYAKDALNKKSSVYLAIVDIDDFKNANDIYGHQYGDEVLEKVASILNSAIVGRGKVGRIGGDEMLMVLDNLFNPAEVRAILKIVRQNVEAEFSVGENPSKTTISVGVSRYPIDADNYEDLFKIADKMLYRAKDKGKNRYIIYSSDLHGDVLNESSEEVKISKASNESKEKFISDILKEFLHDQRTSVQSVIRRACTLFGLDEVIIVQSTGRVIVREYGAEQNSTAVNDFSFLETLDFERNFNNSPFMVVNSIHNLEVQSGGLADFYNSQDVISGLIYKAVVGRRFFYIFMNKKSQSTRKWEDRDLILLQLLGKILEIGLEDR